MLNRIFTNRHTVLGMLLLCSMLIFVGGAHAQEVIVDNGSSGTSFTGTWAVSGGSGFYGSNSVWSRDGATYTWHANLPSDGLYDVYMWWAEYPSRATDAPVQITHRDGTQSLTINQRTNGGRWNLLGRYNFTASSGGTARITAVNGAPTSYCADAVRFVRIQETSDDLIIDNGAAGTSSTGTWAVSGASNPYGSNSVWSRDGATYTWQANLPDDGLYDVYMWWTEYSSRATDAPVRITHRDGTQSLTINQRTNGGRWNLLGRYNFTASSGGTVRITAVNGAPMSYCADAVRFVRASSGPATPIAVINSITPNPAQPGANITFNGSGNGNIINYLWRSSVDGVLGSTAVLTRNNLSTTTHTIYFKVQNDQGNWSEEVGRDVRVGSNVEHIYYCLPYGETNTKYPVTLMLINIGATGGGSNWTYYNAAQNKTYYIHFIQDIESMKQALKTPGAHIIYPGHANYGLGAIFATEQEHNAQTITNITTMDDDRIFKFSSKWISVGVDYLRTKQAYPNFWPVFADGSSSIMPYRFNDPDGPPPYNYYHTYQIPGDPVNYKIETVRNSGIERFFSSDVTPWYSSTGAVPNPSNSNHAQYYVTNYASWYPSVEVTGTWTTDRTTPGFYNENCIYSAAGTGQNQVRWLFSIPKAGRYKIYAWWSAGTNRTTTAPYAISHAGGTTTVRVDQRLNGGRWNELGEFDFNQGSYAVVLSNNVSSGRVIADAVRVSHPDNPPEVIQSDFRGEPLYGAAPLEVRLRVQTPSPYTGLHWVFGDGEENTSREDITHIYTQPGIYTVSLTLTNSWGSDNKTQEDYIYVGNGTQTRAEFSGSPQAITVPSSVSFRDRSYGNIVSRVWDFGDGTTSTSTNPSHTYSVPGNYTIRLTVRDTAGNIHTEVKENFVRAVVFEKNIDNVDYPLTHYGSRTILFRREPDIQEQELKYSRMAYISCNSGNYLLDMFRRGVIFYSLGTPVEMMGVHYLQAYLQGLSDYEIWQVLQSYYPVFDYYNFNKRPSDQ